MIPKWSSKSSKNYAKIIPKSPQNHHKIIPKSYQNHPKIIPKWAENHPKIITNVSHIHPKVIPKSTQNQFKHFTKSSQINQKSPNMFHRSQLIMSRRRHLNDLGWWGFRVTQRARWRGCRRPLDIYNTYTNCYGFPRNCHGISNGIGI